MKLNLGCGRDVKEDYVNVDFNPRANVMPVNLSVLPWPWSDDSAEEILMLDILEHFSYRMTDKILTECWRVLKPQGKLIVQVPDFEECAKAVLRVLPFDCNKCEKQITYYPANKENECPHCGRERYLSDEDALNRLYGGQDYEGNWHHTAFTKDRMHRYLARNGFHMFQNLEEVHQRINWNFKMSAIKGDQRWD